MANTTLRLWDKDTIAPFDLRVIDNGDSTYALATTPNNGPGITIDFAGPDGPVPIRAVALGDGSYALMTTGG